METLQEAASVEVQRLVKRFGSFTAVDDVSFSVQKGEIFGFLGPNGAGKSTTIRILCGLLTPTSGVARVHGRDVAREPEAVRANIGYMSQKFSLYDDLTVEENIEFFSGVYGVPPGIRRERKDDVLAMAGLGQKRAVMTRELAGGWKQRLALGCAILHRPPVLFLDEPTSGVDPIARRVFWDLIYQLSADGHTVFVSTHYMDEAEYCSRLALMYRGRIVAMGTPAELRAAMPAGSLMHLETSQPLESMQALGGGAGILDAAVFGAGLHVRVRDSGRADPLIRALLGEKGIEVRELKAIEPSMEDVFVAVIEREEARGTGAGPRVGSGDGGGPSL